MSEHGVTECAKCKESLEGAGGLSRHLTAKGNEECREWYNQNVGVTNDEPKGRTA